jgi:tetratricopeptide (TPR) repeat protein
MRSARARTLERTLNRVLRFAGRWFGRPDEGLLHELTGRTKGGVISGGEGYVSALDAGRRALETGELGEALFQFSQACAIRPGEAWPWHGRGDALQLSGDHVAALEAYESALERAPRLALAHNGRGNALDGMGRTQDAIEAWRTALELDPRLSWPRRSLERVGAGD